MLQKILHARHRYLPLDRSDWAVLAAGLIVFAAISLYTITKSSVWFDEAFGAYLIRFDFWHVALYTAADVHPPFYYWLLKLWGMLFGTNEFALRSMSVLFGGAAITFGFLLAKRLFGRSAAWYSLLFMVLAPLFVRYSQEMRMYTLVTAIALAATYVLTFAMESKKRLPWIAYGILVSLGMWTHYYSALVWLAHWVWRAWVLRQTNKDRKAFMRAFFSKNWLVAHVVAVGLFVPWLPALVHQVLIMQISGFWIPPVTPATLPNFFTNILYYKDQDTVDSWLTLIFIALSAAFLLFGIKAYYLQKSLRQNYMLVLMVAFVPIGLLIILSMPPLRPSFIERYLITSTLGVSMCIGVTLALVAPYIKTKWRILSAVVVVGAMVIGIASVFTLGNYNKTLRQSNDTRQTVAAVAAKAQPGEPIITDSPWLFYEAVFYETPQHPVYFIDANVDYKYSSLDMLHYNEQHKIRDITSFTREHPVVWYMGRPGASSFGPPVPAWQPKQEVDINDDVSGQPAYRAIQYKTN